MTAGVIWSIILGLVASIGLVASVLWVVIRFPDRVLHNTVPGYMRQAGAPVPLKQREAPEYGGAPTQAAA